MPWGLPAKNILIFGATGVIGNYITRAIVDSKHLFERICVFTSEKTIIEKVQDICALESWGVEVFVGRLEEEQKVKEAYKGIDTVVSCVGRTGIEKQIPLITWAEECGVRRFFASEYGTDIEYWPQSAHEPPHQLKLKVRAHMRTMKKIEHTYLVTGPYSDLYFGPMKNRPELGSFDVAQKKAVLLGDGDGPVSFTAMVDVGKFVVAALLNGNASKNATLIVHSFTATPHEILAEFEEQTGTKWDVSYTSLDRLKEIEREEYQVHSLLAAVATLRRIWTEGGTLYKYYDESILGSIDTETIYSQVTANITRQEEGGSPVPSLLRMLSPKTLPSAYAGAGRHVWTQQMIDARQRSIAAYSADLEEYNRTRVSNLLMTRRELRGDAAVKDDRDADKLRFVRHLDTLNYFNYMPARDAPTGQEVYDSKRGYWRYNKNFMLYMRRRCRKVPAPTGDLSHILHSNYEYSRTNEDKLEELNFYASLGDIWQKVREDFSATQKKKLAIIEGEALPNIVSCNLWRAGNAASQHRVDEWHNLKAHILEALFTQRLDMFQARVHLWHNYAFWAERAEFEVVLTAWSQEYEAIEQQPVLASHDDERELIWQSCPHIQTTDPDEEDLDENQREAENASEENKLLSLLQEEFKKADMRMHNLRPLVSPIWPRTEDNSCGSDDCWSDGDEENGKA
ncbi:hypothetical protein DV736_g5020, partial [Chaetothyriales sp. CBS 134916]